MDGAGNEEGENITTPYWTANQHTVEWFANGSYQDFPASGIQNKGQTAWMLDQPGGPLYHASFITLVVYTDSTGKDVPLAYVKWNLDSHAGVFYPTYTLAITGAGDGEPTVQGNLKFFDIVEKSTP